MQIPYNKSRGEFRKMKSAESDCCSFRYNEILNKSRKSPASIAKSNKQWIGTCLYQEGDKPLLINCEAVIWLWASSEADCEYPLDPNQGSLLLLKRWDKLLDYCCKTVVWHEMQSGLEYNDPLWDECTLRISYAPGFAADFPLQIQTQRDSEST